MLPAACRLIAVQLGKSIDTNSTEQCSRLNDIALDLNTSSHSYRVSLAIWDHTVLPVTRHKWTHPALTPAKQAGTRLTLLRNKSVKKTSKTGTKSNRQTSRCCDRQSWHSEWVAEESLPAREHVVMIYNIHDVNDSFNLRSTIATDHTWWWSLLKACINES